MHFPVHPGINISTAVHTYLPAHWAYCHDITHHTVNQRNLKYPEKKKYTHTKCRCMYKATDTGIYMSSLEQKLIILWKILWGKKHYVPLFLPRILT